MSDALTARLVGFAAALREHGVVAGTSEVADAGLVLTTLGLEDRERLREGLASALMRRAGQRPVFDDAFDVWFPSAVGDRTNTVVPHSIPTNDAERRAAAAMLRIDLESALAAADGPALDRLAARVVGELGRLANEATTGAFSAQQALDALAPQTAIAGALALRGDAPGEGSGFAARFTRDELRSEVAAFRRRVEVETRRRNAEARGRERISRYAIRRPADQVPFLLSGRTDVEELRRTIAPLAKQLATRIAARQRRAARGGIDLRRTLRRSLATGGVPIDPAFARRRPARPDLVVLADLSSSVAGFSRFTILLLQALAAQFRRIRVLGFVNRVDDLTQDVLDAPPGTDLTAVFDDTARLTRHHRNSDYGAVLREVVEQHLDLIGHRTTVLVLGDARTNGTDPRTAELRMIVERAAHVIWLNPEPARSWGSGDSVAHRYAEIVDMHECRNVAQLRQFVTRVLPVR